MYILSRVLFTVNLKDIAQWLGRICGLISIFLHSLRFVLQQVLHCGESTLFYRVACIFVYSWCLSWILCRYLFGPFDKRVHWILKYLFLYFWSRCPIYRKNWSADIASYMKFVLIWGFNYINMHLWNSVHQSFVHICLVL